MDVPNRFIAGRDLYMKACIECHQADGRGVPQTFPPLAGSEWVKGNRDTMLRIMLGGLSGPIEVNGQKFNGVMPGHSHVRMRKSPRSPASSASRSGRSRRSPSRPSDVKALRPDVEKRKFVPWTAEELRALGK